MMMTTQELAEQVISLCTEKKFIEAYKELFHEEAESYDPLNLDAFPLKGLTSLIKREEELLSRAEVHQFKISDLLIVGKSFSLKIMFDYTIGETHILLDEIGVYETDNGKILKQHFFL